MIWPLSYLIGAVIILLVVVIANQRIMIDILRSFQTPEQHTEETRGKLSLDEKPNWRQK